VLARAKWRSRPLSVTLFGDGPQRAGLESMIAYHRLKSVRFGGFASDVAAIWDDHHGLLLASRCEGLPLVLVEAMLSARVPIITDVAGNREMVDDDVTGSLAASATKDALDEALERAWQRRAEWNSIGTAAADAIRLRIPRDPGATLCRDARRRGRIARHLPCYRAGKGESRCLESTEKKRAPPSRDAIGPTAV
jgi:glycosyltransferase involved in cell wall biosynthesis